MTDHEAFVHELIGYIFKVQDKDDDNLSAEIICRKLYKYGLIENVNHEWRMKYRPKHRWPATVHNGRADKEDWQSYTIDRKTENSSEIPNNSTISKMEQVDKDINVRSKDEPQTETEIAKAIVHKMIDDAVIAEDAYPDLRQRMHEAVERLDEYYPSEDERSE